MTLYTLILSAFPYCFVCVEVSVSHKTSFTPPDTSTLDQNLNPTEICELDLWGPDGSVVQLIMLAVGCPSYCLGSTTNTTSICSISLTHLNQFGSVKTSWNVEKSIVYLVHIHSKADSPTIMVFSTLTAGRSLGAGTVSDESVWKAKNSHSAGCALLGDHFLNFDQLCRYFKRILFVKFLVQL